MVQGHNRGQYQSRTRSEAMAHSRCLRAPPIQSVWLNAAVPVCCSCAPAQAPVLASTGSAMGTGDTCFSDPRGLAPERSQRRRPRARDRRQVTLGKEATREPTAHAWPRVTAPGRGGRLTGHQEFASVGLPSGWKRAKVKKGVLDP